MVGLAPVLGWREFLWYLVPGLEVGRPAERRKPVRQGPAPEAAKRVQKGLDELARAAEGMSPAEIKEVCDRAAARAAG
ncbi:MAG: hypothetical protein QME87_11565 [Bacillota bacterium]|nr:hypothetical protein [Bacillota bacterium]